MNRPYQFNKDLIIKKMETINTNIQRIHKNHYLLITNNCVVSFNPEKKSVEDMFKGNYTIALIAPAYYNNPFKKNDGTVLCVESNLADSI